MPRALAWVVGLALSALTSTGCSAILGIQEEAYDGPDTGLEDGGTTPRDDGGAVRPDAPRVSHDSGHLPDAGNACIIDGTTYDAGSANPNDACQVCLPRASAWSSQPDGTPCGSGGVCHVGSCVSGCEIGQVYFMSGAKNPNDACQVCDPATDTGQWSRASDGSTCGNSQTCMNGLCGTGCDIAGSSFAPDAVNPTNPCASCQPGMSTSMWTSDADGTGCGSGATCLAGSCMGCVESAMRCAGGSVETCSGNGTWGAPVPCPTDAPNCSGDGTCSAATCTGGTPVNWIQAQPAWDNDTNTAGTYTCTGALAEGSVVSGQSVLVSATNSHVTGHALFTCVNGSWSTSDPTCDGQTFPANDVECVSPTGDPVETMFLSFYARDFFRCADLPGLDYWVNAYKTSMTMCDSACWESSFQMGSDYTLAQSLGHITPDTEANFCGDGAGYPWASFSPTYVLTTGTQCKYLP